MKDMKKTLQERLGMSPIMMKYAEDPCKGQNFKRTSVHKRLGLKHERNTSAKVPLEKKSPNEHRSSITSHMKRETNVKVTYGNALKVKPVTVVHTHGQFEDEYVNTCFINFKDSVPLKSEHAYAK
ncbi:unnamed protein product [Cuscuta epithymum]|uniref:Uncharacterized protein n=1 Tax=Cuscuta epithymum TaxID=186058 RepID=A0AAV0EZU0_9ASTE|nr:unnamed protein product [Cuscuta epithymum]